VRIRSRVTLCVRGRGGAGGGAGGGGAGVRAKSVHKWPQTRANDGFSQFVYTNDFPARSIVYTNWDISCQVAVFGDLCTLLRGEAVRRAGSGLCVGLASGYAAGWHRAMRRASIGLCGGLPSRAVHPARGQPYPLGYALLARLSRLTVERMWRGTA